MFFFRDSAIDFEKQAVRKTGAAGQLWVRVT
jgi:hypothetical protein